MMAKKIIELNSISKSYGGGSIVLDKVSLSIHKGEFLSIIGKSGSGKSSLLNIIGFLDRYYQGKYLFNSKFISNLSDKKMERLRIDNIGYIFQHYNLINEYNICENIEIPLAYRNISKKTRRKKVHDLLERLDLLDKFNKYPFELSGGEQQRIAIARAIISNPPIILADEPTGSVDERTGKIILDILKELNEKGATICMVTHDMDVAARSDTLIEIRDGRIISR